MGIIGSAPVVTQNKYAQITAAITTTSTTFIDATGLSVTLSTTGGFCLTNFSGVGFNSGANSRVHCQIAEDGTSIAICSLLSPVSSGGESLACHSIRTPSAASHTYKIQWRVDATTGSLCGLMDITPTCQISVIEFKL